MGGDHDLDNDISSVINETAFVYLGDEDELILTMTIINMLNYQHIDEDLMKQIRI